MMTRTCAILALVFALTFLTACGGGTVTPGGSSAEPVRVVLLVRNILPTVAGSFEPGQEIRVKETGALVGTVSSVESTGALAAVGDAEGRLIRAQSPVYVDLFITIEGSAVVDESGFRFGGRNLYVNQEQVFVTSVTQVNALPIELESAGQ